MILGPDDKKTTAKRRAAEMISMALDGRMSTLGYEDLDDENPGATDREKEEIRRHIENYMARFWKVIKGGLK